jgi:glutaredoxin
MGRARFTGLIAIAALAVAGCSGHAGDPVPSRGSDGEDRAGPPAKIPFRLTAKRGDFLFEWVDETGDFETGDRVDEVPAQFRAKVRVEPLTIPPDRRAPPDRVYLADLRQPGRDGVYPVREVPREEFEALAGVLSSPLPRPGGPHPAAPPEGSEAPGGGREPPPGGRAVTPGGPPQVVIYGASWCGACRQAAAWLRGRGIPFVEKDIERDPGAREEMTAKCRAAGITPNSIPILDVRGRVVQGFSPGLVGRLLGS